MPKTANATSVVGVQEGRRMSVYFIADESREFVKIGASKDCERRLKDLQSASPLLLQLEAVIAYGGKPLELCLHQHFARHWMHREWFEYHDDIKCFVAEIGAGVVPYVPPAPYPLGYCEDVGLGHYEYFGYEDTLRRLKAMAK